MFILLGKSATTAHTCVATAARGHRSLHPVGDTIPVPWLVTTYDCRAALRLKGVGVDRGHGVRCAYLPCTTQVFAHGYGTGTMRPSQPAGIDFEALHTVEVLAVAVKLSHSRPTVTTVVGLPDATRDSLLLAE